ncbi:MAG: 5-bromo-4-chloroindolyl phosphate hydrolysis family protein [Thiotrichales bacterium]
MAERVTGKRPTVPNLKGALLGVVGVLMIPAAIVNLFQSQLGGFFTAVVVGVLAFGAAHLTRKGETQAAEYRRRYLAAQPTPYKRYAMLVTAVIALLLALPLNHFSLPVSIVFGILAAVGYYLTYGTDPRGDKIAERLGGYSTPELAGIIQEAERKILDIEHQGLKLGSADLSARLRRIVDIAHDVMELLEKKPSELRRARKFLNVYLDGAQRVVAGFARTQAKTHSELLLGNFRDVLETIETTFRQQREKLLANDMLDLDIQIEVLKKQLQDEGI